MNGQLVFDAPVIPWSERALTYITKLSPGETFTADSLRRNLGDPDESNAVGGIISVARRRGLIRYAHGDERSERALRRGGWLRVWTRV